MEDTNSPRRDRRCSVNSKSSKNDTATPAGQFEFKRQVGLISGASIIVNIIIGAGIFVSPTGVMKKAGSVGAGLLVWLGCGILATFGGISYAEVGTMIPKSGGEFPILLEAFGPVLAFLFAWTSSILLKPASFAILAMIFAQYILTPAFAAGCVPPDMAVKFVAIAVILIVVFINCASVKFSTGFLNILGLGKIISLAIIIIAGIVMLAQGHTEHFVNAFDGEAPTMRNMTLAFYQGLWSFDGWNQLNYIVEELKKPEKNLPRAIGISMTLVTALYMLTNVAYLTAMSYQELIDSPAVGATFASRVLGVMVWIIPFSICSSVFGTCLGICFTAGRIPFVAAREGHFTHTLAMLHVSRLTPAPAVIFTGLLASAMVLPNDFDTLIYYFSFAEWIFYFFTCAALLYFRYTRPDAHRPVKVPIIIPIIVCIAAIFLVIVPIVHEPQMEYFYACVTILAGFLFYIPFVHYGVKSNKLESANIFVQKLLNVAEPTEEHPALS